jgi:uncharacterized protein YecE (DUF72 family)
MIDGRLIRIGTAGWAIPRVVATAFPSEGSALERYAKRFRGVEINSTFYRSHRPGTYARWGAATPPDFAFAVKLPRALTHLAKLVDCQAGLAAFLEELRPLGKKLGPLLVQLPPSLAYDPANAPRFFGALRELAPEHLVACEPRHASWFERESDDLLAGFRVARVAADPGRHPLALQPGGWLGLEYHRLHGSPRMYYSAYGRAYLAALADRLSEAAAGPAWCMFDNTATGAAAANALELDELLR